MNKVSTPHKKQNRKIQKIEKKEMSNELLLERKQDSY